MNSANDPAHLSPEVRAAIGSFLNEVQKDTRPFAISDAVQAVRRVFPDLEISDADLADAVTSEAATAGLDILYDVVDQPGEASLRSMERWENEGGAIGTTEGAKNRRQKADRRKTNDT